MVALRSLLFVFFPPFNSIIWWFVLFHHSPSASWHSRCQNWRLELSTFIRSFVFFVRSLAVDLLWLWRRAHQHRNRPDCWIVNNVMFSFTNQINMDNHFKCIFACNLLLHVYIFTFIWIFFFFTLFFFCWNFLVFATFFVICNLYAFVGGMCVWRGLWTKGDTKHQNGILFSFIIDFDWIVCMCVGVCVCDYWECNMNWSLVTFTWNNHLFKLAGTCRAPLKARSALYLRSSFWLTYQWAPYDSLLMYV